MTCPCGLPAPLAACCGRYHDGALAAPTPEALMRSRYAAFALGTPAAIDYLVATHHPDRLLSMVLSDGPGTWPPVVGK